jgi:hypothetical protein
MEIGNFLPLLLLPLVLAWMLWNKRRLQQAKEEHSDKSAGALASRMGLNIVRGDAAANLLYFQQPSGDFERVLEMSGHPYGRLIQFFVADGRKTSEYVVARKVTSSFGSRLSAEVPSAPVFEVVLRDPNKYLVVKQEYAELPLHEARTGVPDLDARFLIRAENPEIGPRLAGALHILSTHHYVHLAGGSQQLWMRVEQLALGYLATSPEEYLLALETAAAGIEGKSAPAGWPTATPQTAVGPQTA